MSLNHEPLAGNPGAGAQFSLNYQDGRREDYDLPARLAAVLAAAGYETERVGDWLLHRPSGYELLVQIANLELDERVQSTTTLQIHHPTLFPAGIFEYQHSFGADVAESLDYGFQLWLDSDWRLLLAASGDGAEVSHMELTFPDGHRRRVHFGGCQYWQEQPRENSDDEEHPPGCPCCLFNSSLEAFRPLLEGAGNYALRLFVARNPDGSVAADCRVNGEDYPAALESLQAFGAGWPGAGAEFRKQYVLIVGAETPAP